MPSENLILNNHIMFGFFYPQDGHISDQNVIQNIMNGNKCCLVFINYIQEKQLQLTLHCLLVGNIQACDKGRLI